MKVCSSCNKNLHPSDFYKHKESKDGLQNKCKECSKSYNSSRRIMGVRKPLPNASPSVEEKHPLTKRCSKCKELKPSNEFPRNHRATSTKYYYLAACKVCKKKMEDEWRKKNQYSRKKNINETYSISPSQLEDNTEWIYILMNKTWKNHFKIGMTTLSDPYTRLSTYQTGDPLKGYRFVYLAMVTNGREVEDILMNEIQAFNIAGTEWYDTMKNKDTSRYFRKVNKARATKNLLLRALHTIEDSDFFIRCALDEVNENM